MMARASLPEPVQRVENDGESAVQKVDLEEIPLHMAKAQIGKALHQSITRTDSPLKDFGDPSHVKRVCEGDVPSVIARAWQRADTREEFVIALAKRAGFIVEMTMRKRESA